MLASSCPHRNKRQPCKTSNWQDIKKEARLGVFFLLQRVPQPELGRAGNGQNCSRRQRQLPAPLLLKIPTVPYLPLVGCSSMTGGLSKTSHIRGNPFTSLGAPMTVGWARRWFLLVVNGGRSHPWNICDLTAAVPASHSLFFGFLVKGMRRTPKRPPGRDSTATIKWTRNLGQHTSEEPPSNPSSYWERHQPSGPETLMQGVFRVAALMDYPNS